MVLVKSFIFDPDEVSFHTFTVGDEASDHTREIHDQHNVHTQNVHGPTFQNRKRILKISKTKVLIISKKFFM